MTSEGRSGNGKKIHTYTTSGDSLCRKNPPAHSYGFHKQFLSECLSSGWQSGWTASRHHNHYVKAWRVTQSRSICLVVGSKGNEIEHLFRRKIVGTMFVVCIFRHVYFYRGKTSVATACRLQNRAKPGRMLWGKCLSESVLYVELA